jgi:hypothetical protein
MSIQEQLIDVAESMNDEIEMEFPIMGYEGLYSITKSAVIKNIKTGHILK